MLQIIQEILKVTVRFITDFISFHLEFYFYLWFFILFFASLAATLMQRREGSITYSKAECVGINLLVITFYVVIGTILAKYFARFEDQAIDPKNTIVLYKISFLLSSSVLFVDIVLDRLKRGRTFSYSLEFLVGSVFCYLAFQLINQMNFIGVSLSLSYIVLLAIAAGIYTVAMKFLLESDNQKGKHDTP